MQKISEFIVNHTKSIITVFLVLMLVGGVLSTGVGLNLDNTYYLPDNMNSKQAVVKLDEEFEMKGTANLFIKDKEIFISNSSSSFKIACLEFMLSGR